MLKGCDNFVNMAMLEESVSNFSKSKPNFSFVKLSKAEWINQISLRNMQLSYFNYHPTQSLISV